MHRKAPRNPKHVRDPVLRVMKSVSKLYEAIADAFESNDTSKLRAEIYEGRDILRFVSCYKANRTCAEMLTVPFLARQSGTSKRGRATARGAKGAQAGEYLRKRAAGDGGEEHRVR